MIKIAALVLVLTAACGSNKPAVPATPAAPEQTCCCELPADPPVFEVHPTLKCHEDMHGQCGDAAKCPGKP